MYNKIVIPIDLTEKFSWKTVIPPVLNLVNAFGSELHFVHIIPDYGMQMVEDYLPKNWIKDRKKKCQEDIEKVVQKYIPSEIKVHYYIGKGAVYDEVIQYATKENADLIVVYAVRPQLRNYMLGPNASKITRHAETSVLVIRDPQN